MKSESSLDRLFNSVEKKDNIIDLEDAIQSSAEDDDSLLGSMSDKSREALMNVVEPAKKSKQKLNGIDLIMETLAQDLLIKLLKTRVRIYNFTDEQMEVIYDYLKKKIGE